MRRLSTWANLHPWPARIILILLHFVLVCSAIFIGKTLLSLSIFIHPTINILAVLLYLTAVIAYPDKKGSKTYPTCISYYSLKKTCDFVLVFTGIFMIAYFSNHASNGLKEWNLLKGAYPESHSIGPSLTVKKNPDKASVKSPTFSKSERRALLRELRREIKQAFTSTSARGKKTLLVILTCIVTIVLLSLVASLSCSLSCSGNEGGAALVLIFGFAAVIGLLVFVIKKINKIKPKPDNKEEAADTSGG